MKILRDVSGAHLADVLCRRWRYTKVHQVGSPIILETSEPTHQRIAIPHHHPIRLGTLNSILRVVGRHKKGAARVSTDWRLHAVVEELPPSKS